MDDWMPTAFGDDLDLSRCCQLIAKEDLGAEVVALGGSLALLQRDLLKLLWVEEMAREEASALGAAGCRRNGHTLISVAIFATFRESLGRPPHPTNQ